MIKRFGFAVLGILTLTEAAMAFGPKGHSLVGVIAERRLAGKPEAAKVSAAVEGLSLGDVALIADQIKSWDGNPTPKYPWTMKPKLQMEMRAFLQANSNPPGSHGHNPDHHGFHYTDISVDSDLKYSPTKTGGSKTDVVQMITYCIGVINGTIPQPNQFEITPTVAVVLLTHYVGDIHQPLHVGAAYFDATGKRVDPDKNPGNRPDHGGNDIQLKLNGSTANTLGLHAFWDDHSVEAATKKIKQATGGTGDTLTDAEINSHFVSAAPGGAPLDVGVAVGNLSTAWANEILPKAKAAHDRLTFTILSPPVHAGVFTFNWSGAENAATSAYLEFSGNIVDESIHRAGWRLAALFEELF